MIKLNQKEKDIISIILQKGEMQSSEIYAELKEISLVTVKRTLSQMKRKKLLIVKGAGRSTKYEVSTLGRLFFPIKAKEYILLEPDKRYGKKEYNFDVFPSLPKDIFLIQEIEKMDKATLEYQKRIKNLSLAVKKKELERLTIELSWKSSKIEGNTYTLLDTERLILENKQASGKTKEEAQMILNHKDAFNFIREKKSLFKNINSPLVEKLHSFIIKDLKINKGFRKSPVGITGSVYRPLDNIYQIKEAVLDLVKSINNLSDPYAKAMIALLGLSYIQPFEDGNKRTARLIADAILLAYNCAPLSYRSVDEAEYKNSTLVFYEINSLMPFKKIFLEQYDFATKNYAVS